MCIQWGGFNLTILKLVIYLKIFKEKSGWFLKTLGLQYFKTLEFEGHDDLGKQEYSSKGENEVLLKKLPVNIQEKLFGENSTRFSCFILRHQLLWLIYSVNLVYL